MKTLVFLAVASLLFVPSVAAEPGPTPCALTDTTCWWEYVQDHTPLPVCENTWIPEMERICNEIIPPPDYSASR